eukprot:CAMPEP_0115193802 /NCGR_PEP_ID=MMETSP0270-20121206/13749_1 /TAXON_ID=71861 /ORGANISM="Scrippsiella trochoidea, Strain CCMP3099" /LENGTH=82 /DNA_ID=CAMNT_0002607097 /DNA_START=221 /DNA_END=472 /DNA_ORIENTATION=-
MSACLSCALQASIAASKLRAVKAPRSIDSSNNSSARRGSSARTNAKIAAAYVLEFGRMPLLIISSYALIASWAWPPFAQTPM